MVIIDLGFERNETLGTNDGTIESSFRVKSANKPTVVYAPWFVSSLIAAVGTMRMNELACAHAFQTDSVLPDFSIRYSIQKTTYLLLDKIERY